MRSGSDRAFEQELAENASKARRIDSALLVENVDVSHASAPSDFC